MQHTLYAPTGSLVADHRHTFTGERFTYCASYRCDGRSILWTAQVRRDAEVLDDLCGIAPIDALGRSVIAAVKDSVESAIDRSAFFDAAVLV